MIAYPFSIESLNIEVSAEKPNWIADSPRFVITDGKWSEIKAAWIRLQYQKCAYCECKYGNEQYSKIVYDVEHYRPKNAVSEWPKASELKDNPKLPYPFFTGGPSPRGYSLLAYDIRNYAVACKECNTIFKGSAFPVEGTRQLDTVDQEQLRTEEPLLFLPVGSWGDNPRSFIRFIGPIPIPAHGQGRDYRRARITIDFFKLDHREELLRERNFLIATLYLSLSNEHSTNPAAAAISQSMLATLRSPTAPHSACLQDFEALYRARPELAERLAIRASRYLKKVSYSGMGYRSAPEPMS